MLSASLIQLEYASKHWKSTFSYFLPFVFVTLTFFYVTFVLVVTAFATIPTGDGTPDMILMSHCFPIFSVLPSFQLQHTTTAIVAVSPFLSVSVTGTSRSSAMGTVLAQG